MKRRAMSETMTQLLDACKAVLSDAQQHDANSLGWYEVHADTIEQVRAAVQRRICNLVESKNHEDAT